MIKYIQQHINHIKTMVYIKRCIYENKLVYL